MNGMNPKGKSKLRWGAGVLIGILCAVVFAACGGSPGSSSSSSGSESESGSSGSLSTAASDPNATMIVDVATPVATLDPTFTFANQEVGLDGALYSTLTRPKYVPGPIEGTAEQDLAVTAVEPYLAADHLPQCTFEVGSGVKRIDRFRV